MCTDFMVDLVYSLEEGRDKQICSANPTTKGSGYLGQPTAKS